MSLGLSCTLRQLLYYGLDRVKGCPVLSHSRDLERWECGLMPEGTREKRLRELLKHAALTTKFYAEYKTAGELTSFPVISKMELKTRQADFMSSAYRLDELHSSSTSGSYGVPMRFFMTKQKRARQIAEVIYFSRWAGFEVGMKHVSIRARVKSHLSQFIDNQILITPFRLDEQSLSLYRMIFQKRKPLAIIGFPSVIRAVAEYCKSLGDSPRDFSLRSVITSGETLMEDDRALMVSVFGCPVVSRYSNQECGVLAHECVEANMHHINEASYIVEVLSLHDDAPANPGEMGRIVVTDLYSYAMPLIRYDTGDLTVVGTTCKCGRCGSVVGPIYGRLVETITDMNGRPVSAFALNRLIRGVDGILQFQFIQTESDAYEILISCGDDWDREQEVVSRIKDLLGPGARVAVKKVGEIPPLPSGKRPYVINRTRRSPVL